MREQILNRYEGKGQLRHGDDQLVAVDYQLIDVQLVIDDGLGGEVPSLQTIRGRVSTDEPLALYPLIQSDVTLVFEDRRELPVILSEIRPDGTAEVRAQSGFSTPGKKT
jgi:hypothetical protein